MNTLLKNTTLSLFVVAVSVLGADDSSAGLRGRVEVEKKLGPANLRVRLQTPDTVRWHHGPVRERHHAGWHRVSAYDRRVAYRLSIITGIPERPLIRKRARGITWKRIARVHDVTHRELRIAKDGRRFQRWVDRQQWAYETCENEPRRGGRGGRGGNGRGR